MMFQDCKLGVKTGLGGFRWDFFWLDFSKSWREGESCTPIWRHTNFSTAATPLPSLTMKQLLSSFLHATDV